MLSYSFRAYFPLSLYLQPHLQPNNSQNDYKNSDFFSTKAKLILSHINLLSQNPMFPQSTEVGLSTECTANAASHAEAALRHEPEPVTILLQNMEANRAREMHQNHRPVTQIHAQVRNETFFKGKFRYNLFKE